MRESFLYLVGGGDENIYLLLLVRGCTTQRRGGSYVEDVQDLFFWVGGK